MALEESGEVLRRFSRIAAVFGPDARMKMVLPQGMCTSLPRVEVNLTLEGFKNFKVLIDRDGC